MSATQDEIARKLNISQATVSLALRGTGRMSEEMRNRIRGEAVRLGYRPNQSAQAIRTGKFGNISMLMSPTYQHSFIPYELMPGILSEIRAHATQLTLLDAPDRELLDGHFVHEIAQKWSSDGLLINYTHNFPSSMTDIIRTSGIASVWMNAKLDADSVHPDDFGAAALATRHLIELGHRDIGYLDLTRSSHYSVQDRYNGYAETMHAHQLRLHPYTTQVLRPERYPVVKSWLASADRPTAVVTYEDREAIPLFAAAMDLRIRIPEDLSIITIHDFPADSAGVPFATVQNDFYTLGQRAVDMLMKKIRDPKHRSIPTESIAPKWLPGGTLAPPPAKAGRAK